MIKNFSKSVYKHKDVPKAGAKKRKGLKGKSKIRAVMGEYKRGTLRSGGGAKVKSKKQAVAIALSEARRAGAKIPYNKGKKAYQSYE